MKNQKKILFIYTGFSSFVKDDAEILRQQYDVTLYKFNPHPKQIIFSFIKQFFHLIFMSWKYDIVYIWFVDYHSFLPVLWANIAGKKSFLVVGGYDVCRIKELKYGSFINPVRGFMTRISMARCTLNLCVSRYVERKVRWIAPKSKTITIYNGINPIFITNKEVKKENIVLTVGLVSAKNTFYRKGFDRFIQVAHNLPQYTFIIIGINPQFLSHLTQNLPPNLLLYNSLPQEKLIEFYQKAKIYCQFSRMDTFCLTLAEAMAYNCKPIITNVGGMPEVAGDCGYIVSNDPEKITETISKAILENNSDKPSERIKHYFTNEQRTKYLLNILCTQTTENAASISQ